MNGKKVLDVIPFEELAPKKGEAEASVVYYNELARYLDLQPGDKVIMVADAEWKEIRFERRLGQAHRKRMVARAINKELRERFRNSFRTRDDDAGTITTTFWPCGYPNEGEEKESFTGVAKCAPGDPCAHHEVGKAISSLRAYKAFCDKTGVFFCFQDDLDFLCR
jgi:hypothetical protein